MSLTRRLILQKARHHPTTKSRALTDCRHTVSGTLSLPSRGTFHHSLTVLIRYRSLESIQAYRVVPADSQQIPRARCYSGTPNKHNTTCFRVRDSHPLRSTIPGSSTNTRACSEDCQILDAGSHNTTHTTPDSLTCIWFSLIRFRSPLLTESHFVFSSYGY